MLKKILTLLILGITITLNASQEPKVSEIESEYKVSGYSIINREWKAHFVHPKGKHIIKKGSEIYGYKFIAAATEPFRVIAITPENKIIQIPFIPNPDQKEIQAQLKSKVEDNLQITVKDRIYFEPNGILEVNVPIKIQNEEFILKAGIIKISDNSVGIYAINIQDQKGQTVEFLSGNKKGTIISYKSTLNKTKEDTYISSEDILEINLLPFITQAIE